MQIVEPDIEARCYKRSVKLMGNHFEITVVGQNELWAHKMIDLAVGEISRIEQLLTTYNDGSETSFINANAGTRPVEVSTETLELIQRSLRISKLTQGAFDISYGSVDKRLWNFDKTLKALPDPDTARKMVRLINYRNILVDTTASTIFLREAGMRINFGGIGKGYAAEKAKQLLQANGVRGAIINASGDIATLGRQPDGKPWTIGIAHPDLKGLPFSYLDISDAAIATSGNYEKFVMIDGKKYSHTIDPRTGLPVTGIKSVTVLCANAEIADALATPVTIMGISAGLHLVNQLQGVGCIMIDDQNKTYTSKNINFS